MGLLSRLHEAGYNIGSLVIGEDYSLRFSIEQTKKKSTKVKNTPFFGEKHKLPKKGVLVIKTQNTQGQIDDFTITRTGDTIKIKNSKGITQAKTWGTYKRIVEMIELI